MNIITVVLCAFLNQVTSQTNANVTDVFPAKILAQEKTISENSDLYVTCSTFGLKKNTKVYVYLCKDENVKFKRKQKQDQTDTTFTISKVGLHDSGNYSCFYSKKDYSLSKVDKKEVNIIQIVVIANFLPADLSVVGPSTVSEGDNVDLRCTVSDTLQTLGKCLLIHSYLTTNESILQVRTFNVMMMEAFFTIEGAVTRDSGHYSCVVLPSKCIQEHEKTLHGNNTVILEVKESSVPRLIYSFAVITLMLSLGLCVWCMCKRADHSDLRKPCAASQQANTDVLEEQQERAEGEDLEAQDGDSFSMEEEAEYYDGEATEDVCEGIYSLADDPPARPYVYAASSKWKTRQR